MIVQNLKKSSVLVCAILMSAFAHAQKTATCVISTGTKYQYIYGFGGCGMSGTWGADYTDDMVDLMWGDGVSQANLNIMRIRIAPDERNWGKYVSAVKRARQHGATVFATPWTPPYRFKVGYTIVGGQSSAHGHINTDSCGAYARWLEKYRVFMEEQGAPVDIISIQNECDWDPDYEGCLYTEEEMAQMVDSAKEYINCKIMAPECFGWDSYKYNRNFIKYDASKKVDVFGNHLYGAQEKYMSYVDEVRKATGKDVWMTEHQLDSVPKNWKEYTAIIKDLHKALSNNMSAYVYYNMINQLMGNKSTASSDEVNNGYENGTLTPGGYIMAHYAKFVTGYTRVKATMTDNNDVPIIGTAYISPSADTLAIIIFNEDSVYSRNILCRLPFSSKQVFMYTTNADKMGVRTNVSSLYANKTMPRISVPANSFVTLQFIKDDTESDEDPVTEKAETSVKGSAQGNPISPFIFCADPTAIEYNGRIYVYGTNDSQQFEANNGGGTNSYGAIKSLVIFSSDDMVNWTHHGIIDVSQICGSWCYASWAPSIVSRVEDDGLTHFYLYFSNSATGVGVLTATDPLGPWTSPLNKSLINKSTAGVGNCSSPFDPGVAIDDNGTGWIAFGGGSVNDEGTTLMPGNARIAKLGTDMTSIDGEAVEIPAPYQFEASELNVMNGTIVYSYCTNWSAGTDWDSYGSTANAPTACSMCYMSSTNPLNSSSWKYRGQYFANPGKQGFSYSNNHTHLQKWGNAYYLFYHTTWLEKALNNGGDGFRSIQVNRAGVVEKALRINNVSATTSGCTQVKRVDPYSLQQAEMMADCGGVEYANLVSAVDASSQSSADGNMVLANLDAGDWIMARGVNFGSNGATSFMANLAGKGIIEVRLDDPDAQPSAKIVFSADGITTFQVDSLDAETFSGLHNVYLFFSRAENVRFDSWMFSDSTSDGIDDIRLSERSSDIVSRTYYDLSGRLLQSNDMQNVSKRVVICKTKYSDGHVETEKVLK